METKQVTTTSIASTELAALYVRKEQETILLTPSDKDILKGLPSSVPTVVEVDVYTLYVTGFEHEQGEFTEILELLRGAGEGDKLEIRISSNGGCVLECVSIYNIVKEHFLGRTTTFLDTIGASGGGFTFMYGDKRVAYDFSLFMAHDGATEIKGDFSHISDAMAARVNHTRRFFKKLLVDNGCLTKEEYERITTSNYSLYLDSYEMAKRGIATHVIVDNVELTSEEYVDYIDMNIDIESFLLTCDITGE